MDNHSLISVAEAALRRYVDEHGRLHGDVAAAVLGNNGKVYVGIVVDTPSWGICAERSALSAMITDGEYFFQKIVAVWRDDKTTLLHVLPPCGHCRQFMRDIGEKNMDAEVILGLKTSESLRTLLPYHAWPKPLVQE